MVCNDVRLESVDDMGYSVNDTTHGRTEKDGKVVEEGIACVGRGEVCYRGFNIFKGYYKNPEKTAEALSEDGWLHSGDIGLWDANGHLRIIDRKKNIFKLAQGEYVAAEKIENVYAQSAYVAQVFVYGDSLQSCLVGVVVPDQEYVMAQWAPANAAGKSFEEICADEAFKKVVFADMDRAGKEGGLHGFEKVRALHLTPELWSVENDLLTPTFKLKRNVARDRFREQIDGMYASGLGTVAGKTGLRQGEASGSAAAA
jgi:long-chain acyl-CoA synthetase